MSEKMSQDLDQGARQTANAAKAPVDAGVGAARGVKAAKRAVQKGAKAAAELTTTAGRIKWASIVAAAIILLIVILMTDGTPGPSMNSFTGINPAQDPIEEVDENGMADDYVDMSDAQNSEAEAIDILGKELALQKDEAENKVKEAAEKKHVSAEATLQMMNANFVTLGGVESVKAHQKNGEYTEEEFQASVLLSAYSITVDNLWGFNTDYEGNVFVDIDTESIDTSSKEGRATYIFARLVRDGCTTEVACAIMGNLEKENGAFDPSVGEKGGSKAGRGIAQWTKGGGRWDKLIEFAKKNGTQWNDLRTQVDTLLYEINGGESTWASCLKKCHAAPYADLRCDTHGYSTHGGLTPEKFKKLRDIGLATCIFRDHFERPGKVASSKVSVRLGCAKKWHTKFKDMTKQMITVAGVSGDPAKAVKHHKKYTELATIGEKDVQKWFEVPKQGNYRYAEAMVWMGNGTYALTLMRGDPRSNKHIGMVVKYKGKTLLAKQKTDESRHSNGIAYNAQEGKLYVSKARPGGGDRSKLTVFNASNLAPQKTRKIKDDASNIGYDNATQKYVISGKKLRIYDKNFKRIKQVKKIKHRPRMQDVNCFNGIVFVTEYSGGQSYIDTYRLSDGKYLGSLKVSLGEIEDVCIDDNGYLLLIHAHRQIYKSKKRISEYLAIPDRDASVVSAASTSTGTSSLSSMSEEEANQAVRNAAVEWGKKIGEDNSFHYGKKPWSVNLGCYFCETNQPKDSKKAKAGASYKQREKTWSCCTFVTACYVHGAKAKGIDCKKHWIGTGENKGWGAGHCLSSSPYWKKMGDVPYEELLPGDIIIFKTHTTIYAGDGKLIQSHGGDDGKVNSKKWNRSIGLWDFNKKKYKKRKHVVWRYIGGAEGTTLESVEAPDGNLVSYGPGSWRYDLQEKFHTFLEKEDYYKMTIEKDEEGKAVKYDGVISSDTSVVKDLKKYEKKAKKEANQKLPQLGDLVGTEDAAQQYTDFINKNTKDSNIGENKQVEEEPAESEEAPKLKQASYINVALQQKDIYAFASAAFGLTAADVREKYGPAAKRDATLRDMALDQIALLHDVGDVTASRVEENYEESYKIGKLIGNYNITTYTNSTEEGKQNMRQVLTWHSRKKTSPRRKAMVTCAAPKDIPIGTVIYVKKLDCIFVVEDTLKGSDKTIAIYTGYNQKKAEENEKELNKKLGKKKQSRVYLALGITPNEARSIGGFYGGKGAEGAVAWGKKICDDQNFVYVDKWGQCHFCNDTRKAYVCTTFVKACYAHGAKDPEILKWCKGSTGDMVNDLHNAMKKSSHWKSMGKISIDEMKPGDVIFFGSGHVEMCSGKNEFMGAHTIKSNRADDISYGSGRGGYTDIMRYTYSGATGTDTSGAEDSGSDDGKYRVFIETGHGIDSAGKWDSGATWKGYQEAKLMLPIAKAMADYLKAKGVYVYTDAYSNNDTNLFAALDYLDSHDFDAFVNIHCDSADAPSGTLPLYRTADQKKLAEYLNAGVHKAVDIKDRGLQKRTDLDSLNSSKVHCAACLFETGSIKKDNKVLTKNAKAYGEGLAKGLLKYLESQ